MELGISNEIIFLTAFKGGPSIKTLGLKLRMFIIAIISGNFRLSINLFELTNPFQRR